MNTIQLTDGSCARTHEPIAAVTAARRRLQTQIVYNPALASSAVAVLNEWRARRTGPFVSQRRNANHARLHFTVPGRVEPPGCFYPPPPETAHKQRAAAEERDGAVRAARGRKRRGSVTESQDSDRNSSAVIGGTVPRRAALRSSAAGRRPVRSAAQKINILSGSFP